MKIYEEQLEDYIFETYTNDPEKLQRQGLSLYGDMSRQMTFGNYGRCDLMMIQPSTNFALINIVELKKGMICIKAFLQAIRYAKGIQRHYEINHPEISISIEITLIGSEIDTSTEMAYISDVLEGVTFYTYEFGWDGIQFKPIQDYRLINEGFKS
jgi:hypothetical protein